MIRGNIHGSHVAILPKSRSTYEVTGLERTGADGLPKFGRNSHISVFTENLTNDVYWNYGDVRIIPNGPDNLFPQHFKMLLDNDNIAPGVLRQKIDLLTTGGCILYQEKVVGKEIVKEPVIDNAISDFLDSFDFYEKYLLPAVTDFVYIENVGALLVNNEAWAYGGIFGNQRVSEVKRIPIEDIRMGWEEYSPSGFDPQFYYVANWLNPTNIYEYPAFSKTNPWAAPASLKFVKMPSFCDKFYGRPPSVGIANYIALKVLILNWSQDNLKNTGFKYHIQSPLSYWLQLKQSNSWTDQELNDYEDEFMETIDKFLQSDTAENAAKRLHTKFAIPEFGKSPEGWKIDVLEDKTKQNSEAYLAAASHYNEGTIAALHLDPSLSNIQTKGSLSSGIDKLIAFNIHQLTTTPTPRRLILSPVNEAIRLNFWTDKYRPQIGFPDIQLDYLQKTKTSVDLVNSESNENTPQNN